jgi:hypothetical protein
MGSIEGAALTDGLLYVGCRLLIPQDLKVCKLLYNLAHDTLGHFGFDKSYEALHESYYWPHMRRDLKMAYIPSCTECQRNKNCTTKPTGLLHPLVRSCKGGRAGNRNVVGFHRGTDGDLASTCKKLRPPLEPRLSLISKWPEKRTEVRRVPVRECAARRGLDWGTRRRDGTLQITINNNTLNIRTKELDLMCELKY